MCLGSRILRGPMDSMTGKAVVITGAAGGIGAAVARFLAARGASLVLNDLGCDVAGAGADPSAVNRLADELKAAGARVETSSEDITAPHVPDRLVAKASETFGRLDAVVSCAGIY